MMDPTEPEPHHAHRRPALPVRSYRKPQRNGSGSHPQKLSPRPAAPSLPVRSYRHQEPVKLRPSAVRSSAGSRRDLIRRSPSKRPKAPGLTYNSSANEPDSIVSFARQNGTFTVSSHDLQGLSNNRPDRFRSAEIGKDILSETLSTGTNVRFAGGSSRHSADARKAFLPKHSTSRSSASSRPAAPTLKPPRPHSTDVKLCKALYDFSSEYADTFSFQAEQVFLVVDDSDAWWKVRQCDDATYTPFGATKLAPGNYLEHFKLPLVDASQLAPRRPKRIASHTSATHTSSSSITSQVSLPPASISTDRSSSFSKKEKKRFTDLSRFYLCVLELVASEYKYVLDLTIINDCFVQMLASKGKQQLSGRIFSVWENMLVVHDQLFYELLQTLPSQDELKRQLGTLPTSTQPRIQSIRSSGSGVNSKLRIDFEADGARLKLMEQLHLAWFKQPPLEQEAFWVDILSTWALKSCKVMRRLSDYLKACIPYIANYQSALDVLEELATTDPKTLALINASEAELKGLHLRDYLIKPVQRVCKYPLLLREIERRALDEPAKTEATAAKKRLEAVADRVNEMVRLHEKGGLVELLTTVREQFRPRSLVHSLGLDKHLFEPTTKLYRKGSLSVAEAQGVYLKPDTYEVFLLTDFMLFTESYMNYFKQRERLNIKAAIRFHQVKSVVRVRDAHDNKAFRLIGPKLQLTCLCSSNILRDGWIDDIQKAFQAFRDSEARKRAVEASKRPLGPQDVSPIRVEQNVVPAPVQAERKTSFTFDAQNSSNPGIANAMLLAREFKSLQRRKKV